MEAIIIVMVLIMALLIWAFVIHTIDSEKYDKCDKHCFFSQIDDTLSSNIEIPIESNFDYIYMGDDLPLGRISAFLNYFDKNIYNEEPYAYFCNRSSRDNEFREYGCVFARTGVYITIENPNNKAIKEKDNSVLKASEKMISFEGLTHIVSLGSLILVVNYNPSKLIDDYHVYSVFDASLARVIVGISRIVINKEINFSLQKNLIDEIVDDDNNGLGALIRVKAEESAESDEPSSSDIFKKTEKKLDSELLKKGINTGGIQAIKPRFSAMFAEVKHFMNGARGHGYAAEYANNTVDRIMGRRVENAAQRLDDQGRQVKHGADRIVNQVEIQTKYYKTAPETIGAAFENKKAIYLRSDSSGKMMQIEVPRDQYKEALVAMQKRIDNGEVPNVTPGEDARTYVRKGFFTYEQSYNIARAGTIESLAVDTATGAVCCFAAAGMTSVIMFALSIWQGNSPKEAARQCLSTSLTIMGKGTLIYVLTMQLSSRKEIALALAGKAFTKDGFAQGYKTVANPMYYLSENLATRIAKSKLATTALGQKIGMNAVTGKQIIGGTVTFAVVFGPDIMYALQGKISVKQLIKNSTVAAAGMAGAAVAQAAIPVPFVPAIVGGATAGFITKKTLDHFIEDDAKEMFRILKEEFIDMTMLTGLSEDEFTEVAQLTVSNKKISKMLQKMYQSDDRRAYARNEIMRKAISLVIKKRTLIKQESLDHGLFELLAEPV